jgi:hypothetical protein
MCQLRHPNIKPLSADDVYFSTNIAPSASASPATRVQDLFIRMPYYPADLAWLIYSSPQVLTIAHIQVCASALAAPQFQRALTDVCAASRRRSTFWSKCCAACGDCKSCCELLACARLTCAAGTCTLAASFIAT